MGLRCVGGCSVYVHVAKCAHTSVKSVEVNVYFLCFRLGGTARFCSSSEKKWCSINPLSPPELTRLLVNVPP